MGYRYDYRMFIQHPTDELNDEINDIVDILDNESGYEWEVTYWENTNQFIISVDDISWDEPAAVLQLLSEKYPERLFKIYYVGYDWDDRGIVYGRKGQAQICKMITSFEEPSEFFKN